MDKPPETRVILVVDDEPVNVELLQAMLESEGYRVEAASDGPEALGRARREPPDLVVLDLMMPKMDGFEVCRHLKADGRTADVPILMVTGLSDVQNKEQGLAAGADDYITKPVQRADLLARIRSLLRVRHLSQELDRTLAYLEDLESTRNGAAPAARPMPPPPIGQVEHKADAAALVLVVDDDRFVRLLYGKLLEQAGYHALAVPSAAEAYAAAAHGVDVILLDIMMPGVSGLDALGRLKQIAPEVPIIILTAYQSIQNAIAALRGGAFDFIVKGMKNEILINAVARAVERRRLMQENRRLMEEVRARLDVALSPLEDRRPDPSGDATPRPTSAAAWARPRVSLSPLSPSATLAADPEPRHGQGDPDRVPG